MRTKTIINKLERKLEICIAGQKKYPEMHYKNKEYRMKAEILSETIKDLKQIVVRKPNSAIKLTHKTAQKIVYRTTLKVNYCWNCGVKLDEHDKRKAIRNINN